jgi:predicted O-methyltransferase YrrM
MSLVNYLASKNCKIEEGNCRNIYRQTMILQTMLYDPNKNNILEIGFNAGHSADLFLNTKESCTVTSFDIGYHSYCKIAKEFIDTKYPNRHTLILGDSTKTIPTFQTDNKYDLIFIDGGHQYQVAKADLSNCKRLAHSDTIVVMDDTMYRKDWETEWTIGPTRAWQEGLKSGLIKELSHYNFERGRGMSWGKYNM